MRVTRMLNISILCLCLCPLSCNYQHAGPDNQGTDDVRGLEFTRMVGKGALLLTRFKSLAELKSVVAIDYKKASPTAGFGLFRKDQVRLRHSSEGREVTCILKAGISEDDFLRAREGHLWDRIRVVLKSPFALFHKNNLIRVEILGRRRNNMFGEGDIAFYDLAEATVDHITDADLVHIPTEDLSEKGYLNTFNHITAQAFMTTLFSDKIAEYVSAVHERHTMPTLVTGVFTEDQLTDLESGPVDNYLDLVNNEWGQLLGKVLQKKYDITKHTIWTPDLLASYLNDTQNYYSRAFGIGFSPFRPTDDMVLRFANKLNRVLYHIDELEEFYQ